MRILVLENQLEVRNLISLALKHQGYTAECAENTPEAMARLCAGASFSALLVAVDQTGDIGGLIACAKQRQPAIGIIGTVQNGSVAEERLGLDDVVVKPITGESLRKAFAKVLARSSWDGARPVAGLAPATSAWRVEMESMISHVALADVPVLVRGETGSGKEVLARELHGLSRRSRKPFLKVNCAALPSELIESELFGYERGAFTGAFKTTPGKFEMADGGTILLDEIGDMPFKLQAKLLQVLQDCEVTRLGSSEARKIDVRVIAATHCDLEAAITENRFREDLYYRLNIIHIHVPPLRDRTDEILPLAKFFMRKYANSSMPAIEITDPLAAVLLAHDWPGNIRELENIIRRLLVLRRADYVAHDIQTRSRRRRNVAASPIPAATSCQVEPAAAGTAVHKHGFTPANGPAGFAPPMVPPMSGYDQAIDTAHHEPSAVYRAPQEPVTAVTPASCPPAVLNTSGKWSVLEEVDHARREAETEAILNALNSRLWNRKRAAELLNIDYKALLYKMKKLGIVERAGAATGISAASFGD
jgi:two-component system response regulator AtoC